MVAAITYLSLVVGELVPKQLALRAPERTAARVAPAIDLLARISTPAAWLLETSSLLLLRLLGSEAQPRETVTEEEVRTLIAEGTRTGVFHQQEQEMIGRVLRLADRPLRAIMTPRVELVCLDVDDDPARIAQVIQESGHSRFVVGKGGLDEVLGVVHVRRLLEACLVGRPLELRAAVRPALVLQTACRCCGRWKRSARPGSASRWWSTSMARSRAWSRATTCSRQWSATCPSAASARSRRSSGARTARC